jgi:enoyl reductase
MLSRRTAAAAAVAAAVFAVASTTAADAGTGPVGGGSDCTVGVAAGGGSVHLCSPGGRGTHVPGGYTPGSADYTPPVCWFGGDPHTPQEMLDMYTNAVAVGDTQVSEDMLLPVFTQIKETVGPPVQPGSWYGAFCRDDASSNATVAWGTANHSWRFFPPGVTAGLATPGELAKYAAASLTLPDTTVVLDPAARSTVNAPTTVTVQNPGPVDMEAAIGGVYGKVTATEESMWIDVPEVAQGLATVIADGPVKGPCSQAQPVVFAGGNASCDVTYNRSTYHLHGDDTTGYPLTVHVTWQYTYDGGGPAGTVLDLPGPQFYPGQPVTENVVVQEIQTVVVP